MTDKGIENIIRQNGGSFKSEEFLANRERLTLKIVEGMAGFRNWHGYSTQITSAYRETGSHSFGSALDVLIWSKWRKEQPSAMEIWRLITTWPWMGVGIYFDWKDGIGVHVDLCTAIQRPRPLRWLRLNGVYYYQSLQDGLFYTNHTDPQFISLEQAINLYNKQKGI